MKLSTRIILVGLAGLFGFLTLPSFANAEDEIAAANPDIDFNELIIGISYTLVAPESAGPCVCDWAISNEFIGAFNPTDECETQLIIFIRGGGQLSVDVDCEGDDILEFDQIFMSRTPDPAVTLLTGSGCSLIRL